MSQQLELNNRAIAKDIIENIDVTDKHGNYIKICCINGNIKTTKLLLASWSSFWKNLLQEFDELEDSLAIYLEVDITVLKKMYTFLTTGQVKISGPQENIDVLAGLEMLLPNLELSDPSKLILEEAEITEKDENDDANNSDDFKFEVKENFICNICLVYFSGKQARDNHIKNIHNKPKTLDCEKCSKTFFSKSGLMSHMKIHNKKQNRFSCVECKKSYKNESDLLKHCKSKGHSEEIQKFDCTECDFSTNRVDNLYRHERDVHGLYNIRVDSISKTLDLKGEVKCYKCNKIFTEFEEAKDHLLRETCDTIKCEDCDKIFRKKADLLLHIRDTHTGNTFSCQVCSKVFRQKRNLKRHAQKCKNKNEHITENISEDTKLKKVVKERNKRKKLERKKQSKQKPEDMIETNPKNRWEEAENHLKEKQKTVENSQLKRSIYGFCKRDK